MEEKLKTFGELISHLYRMILARRDSRHILFHICRKFDELIIAVKRRLQDNSLHVESKECACFSITGHQDFMERLSMGLSLNLSDMCQLREGDPIFTESC